MNPVANAYLLIGVLTSFVLFIVVARKMLRMLWTQDEVSLADVIAVIVISLIVSGIAVFFWPIYMLVGLGKLASMVKLKTRT